MNMNGLKTEFYEHKAHGKCKGGKTIFVALPKDAWRPITGECACPYCKAHPEQKPQWDTLVIDPTRAGYTSMCHYPELSQPLCNRT